MSKERCAELLARGLERKLAVGDRTVSATEVSAWLEGRGLGMGAAEPSEQTSSGGTQGKGLGNLTVTKTVTEQVRSTGPETARESTPDSRGGGGAEEAGPAEPTAAAVATVWRAWQELTSSERALDAKSEAKIVDRLADGFSAAQLCEACRRAVENPALVGRTKLIAVSKPLQSAPRVRLLLGLAEPPRTTWLTPFDEAWQKQYATGSLAFGAFARTGRRLSQVHGEARVLDEFRAYVALTPIEYVSWTKFADGFGTWRHRKPKSGRASSGVGNIW